MVQTAKLLMTMTIALAAGALPAQSAPSSATAPQYDVVSIKPNTSGSGSSLSNSTLDHYKATNVSLKRLIQYAYGLRSEDQIAGLAGPVNSARFDIEAKVDADTVAALRKLPTDERRMRQQAMMRAMLADRFQLKIHRESKESSIYGLVTAKGGPKLKEADPSKTDASATTGKDANYRPGSMGTSVNGHNGKITAQAVPLSSLADGLTGLVDRMVVDKTGLGGKYDIELLWTQDQDGETKDDTATEPSIFTALRSSSDCAWKR